MWRRTQGEICTNEVTFYGRFFFCSPTSAMGQSNILQDILLSCDTYSYTLAARLGIEKIAYWAHKVG